MHLTNFYFCRSFFLIASSYQILQNDMIRINHESFSQKKNLQNFAISNFWKEILLWLKPLKINFPKQNSYKQIAAVLYTEKLFIAIYVSFYIDNSKKY